MRVVAVLALVLACVQVAWADDIIYTQSTPSMIERAFLVAQSSLDLDQPFKIAQSPPVPGT
jgi:hypothetical protein